MNYEFLFLDDSNANLLYMNRRTQFFVVSYVFTLVIHSIISDQSRTQYIVYNAMKGRNKNPKGKTASEKLKNGLQRQKHSRKVISWNTLMVLLGT